MRNVRQFAIFILVFLIYINLGLLTYFLDLRFRVHIYTIYVSATLVCC